MSRLLQALNAPTRDNVGFRAAGEVSNPDRHYDTGVIRTLIDEALDDDDLLAFTYDYFKPVYQSIELAVPKKAKIQKLIEYAEQEHQLDKLRDYLAQTHPKEYRRYVDHLERSPQ